MGGSRPRGGQRMGQRGGAAAAYAILLLGLADALNKGAITTFFRPETPLALASRVVSGDTADLSDALRTWKAWIPPKLEQGLQQGGLFCFDGEKTIFQHYDPSTGVHADMDAVLKIMGL